MVYVTRCQIKLAERGPIVAADGADLKDNIGCFSCKTTSKGLRFGREVPSQCERVRTAPKTERRPPRRRR
jgi:hypothetical protein